MCYNKIPYKEEPCVKPIYGLDIDVTERIRVIIIDDDEEESDSENDYDE